MNRHFQAEKRKRWFQIQRPARAKAGKAELHAVWNCLKAGASEAARPDRQAEADGKHTAHSAGESGLHSADGSGGTDELDIIWSDVSVH